MWLATVLLIKTKFSSLKSGNNDRRKNGGGHPIAKFIAPVSRERPAVTLSLGALTKAPPATFKWDAMTSQWPTSSVKNGLSRQITNKKVKTWLELVLLHQVWEPVQSFKPLALANCLTHNWKRVRLPLTATKSLKLLSKMRSFSKRLSKTPY